MSDVFSGEPLADPNEITVETLVGDGKKYADANALAKAYANADSFIEQQKARIAELETEVKVRSEIQSNQRHNANEEHNSDEGRQVPAQPDPNANKANDVDLSALVRQELEEADKTKKAIANVEAATNEMLKVYGSPEKANAALHKRAKELDVSVEWLRDSAARSPAAFLASMGISNTNSSSSPYGYSPDVNIRGSINSKKNFRYFEDIRKSDPNRYFSRDVQKELFEARKQLGEDAFYN